MQGLCRAFKQGFCVFQQKMESGWGGVLKERDSTRDEEKTNKNKTAISRVVQEIMDTPWRCQIGSALNARPIFDVFRMRAEAFMILFPSEETLNEDGTNYCISRLLRAFLFSELQFFSGRESCSETRS